MTHDFGPRFYGRQKGRPLRKEGTRLMEELLPTIMIDLPAEGTLDLAQLFGEERRDLPLWIEIGFGGGEHLAWQAKNNPAVNFIAIEPFINGIASFLKHHEAEGLRNVRLYPRDLLQLLPCLPSDSATRFFMLFPDPWHKKRHNRRRLFREETIVDFLRILQPEGLFTIATDDPDYLAWILERALAEKQFHWTAKEIADIDRPPNQLATRYEEKAALEGRRGHYIHLKKKG